MLSPSSHLSLWKQAVARTKSRSPGSFERWFSSVQYDGLVENVLTLTARDEFVRDWVKEHFIPDLLSNLEAMSESSSESLRVEWKIAKVLDTPVCPASPKTDPSSSRLRRSKAPSLRPTGRSVPPNWSAAQISTTLNPKYTFGAFVVGPSNELAHAAALASAGGNGKRYNPLFVAGGTGLGKTHLMHAIAHKVLGERPDARVLYVSAEYFTNAFIEAIQHQKMDEFRSRYRVECDLILLDDIQFLAGREQTQEEFFHTFNALIDANKPVIVTSDKYPQQLQRMPERLVSRFTSGLVADIQAPQFETRIAILRKKAQLESITISDDVAVMLAQNIRSNVRELEGALIRLAAKVVTHGTSD